MPALQGVGLLFALCGPELVLLALPGVDDHLYAGDPRQEGEEALGLFLRAARRRRRYSRPPALLSGRRAR